MFESLVVAEKKPEIVHHPGKHVIDFFPETDIKNVRWREYVEFVEMTVNNPKNFIDKGGAGEVYEFGSRGICIKLMQERHHSSQAEMFNLGNSVSGEAYFLEQLSDFTVEGVRSPAFVEYFEGKEKVGIVMEQLDALNMQHILNGWVPLPEDFDVDDFFDRLEAYIDELHDQMQVCHGDLEPRNVMLDRKTGLPRIIDFGRSHHLGRLSEEKRRVLERQDIENLDKAKAQIQKLMQQIS